MVPTANVLAHVIPFLLLSPTVLLRPASLRSLAALFLIFVSFSCRGCLYVGGMHEMTPWLNLF
jgi:hypothetical protein